MKNATWIALALGISLVGAVRADPTTAPSTATTQPLADDSARWQGIAQQLGADDFAQRDAAQKQLETAGPAQLELLRRIAAETKNPEIEARLTIRIANIEDEIAVNPPPISLELNNATTADTADALSKALGVHIGPWPPQRFNGDRNRFMISAHNKPFWDVFIDLSRQHEITIRNMGSGIVLMAGSDQKMRNAIILGPVVIVPQSVTRQRIANLQNDPTDQLSPETMNFASGVAIDPRLHIVKFALPEFTSVVDNTGNVLFQQDKPSNQLQNIGGWFAPFLPLNVLLHIPEKQGNRIASAKGLIHFVAQTKAATVEITDAEKHVGEDVAVGNRKFNLTRFTVTQDANNTSIVLGLTSPRTRLGPNPNRMRNQSGPVTTLSVLDSTGAVAFTGDATNGMGASVGGNYTGPYTLRFSTPTRTHEVSIPFELKDLPLP